MKKIIIPIIMVLIMFLYIPFSNASSKAVVKDSGVRMRQQATTDSEIVTVIYQGDECELLEDNGEWIKIKYENNIGYSKKEFFEVILDKKDSDKINETAKNKTETNIVGNTANDASNKSIDNGEITTMTNEYPVDKVINVGENYTLKTDINLRNIPSLTAKNKITIIAQTELSVTAKFNNWYKIFDGTKIGWITKEKLNIALQDDKAETEIKSDEKVKTETKTEEKVSTETEQNVENKIEKQENNNTVPNTNSSETVLKTGIVNVDTARVREKASTDSEIIGTLDEDEIINIVGEEGDFYKFNTSSISGYVSKKLVTEKDISSRSTVESRENVKNDVNNEVAGNVDQKLTDTQIAGKINNANGNKVIELAKQYLGYSYVSGGKNPSSGFDCSGFTKYIFSNFGVELGSTAASQANVGTEVARENLQTGDIILYYDEGMTKIGHVGIYIQDGEFIHSANPKRGVVIDNLNTNSYYNKRYITARRLIN